MGSLFIELLTLTLVFTVVLCTSQENVPHQQIFESTDPQRDTISDSEDVEKGRFAYVTYDTNNGAVLTVNSTSLQYIVLYALGALAFSFVLVPFLVRSSALARKDEMFNDYYDYYDTYNPKKKVLRPDFYYKRSLEEAFQPVLTSFYAALEKYKE